MRRIQLSIKNKLIIYFLISILLPTTIISIIFYTRSSEIITDKINLSIVKNLSSVESILLQKLDSINDFSVLMALNPELQHIISSPQPDNADGIIDEIVKLDRILDSYYLSDFSALTKTALYPKLFVVNRPQYKNVNITDKVFDISAVENQKWYSQLPNQLTIVGTDHITMFGKKIQTMKIAKKLVALRAADMAPYAALLTTDIDANFFVDLLKNYKITPGSSISLLNADGDVLLSSDLSPDGPHSVKDSEVIRKLVKDMHDQAEQSHMDHIDGKPMLISTNYIVPLKWTILSLTPLNEVNIEQKKLNQIMVFVIVICMLFALLTALVLSGNISKPILALVKSMSTIEHGNFDIKLRYRKKDEFGILFEQYKQMMEKIKDLVERLYVSEVSKKEAELQAKDAELKALQAQINPHFLYNALDSINLYAMRYNVPNISDMVSSLSNFFRYGLSKGKSIITLNDEKKHVESYLEIQKMRFGGKLNYTLDFPNDILQCLTVKLILQPLVENSIIHGIQKVEGEGWIRLSVVKQGEKLQISISDNGAGANVEEMHEMLDFESHTSKSFGTRNVNERIKRLFGMKYGVRFYINEGGGLTSVVEIPILWTMEGYHVEDGIS
ncbi:sensor histidine kinase [Paenibacillus sp. FSL H7-0331]|uniref:sensor histidine kinase n=1 Tax=Paenibacillus sp. FSL H7-0331 TaxID=1920421 RepID=UPI00096E5A3C|nr:sensor histidine kinase [Paenibacillus sp. FSL H7-0331]OMF09246.1 hypothetical protein BK127_27190 [Paenibacillus sp. FSL H7-0331]